MEESRQVIRTHEHAEELERLLHAHGLDPAQLRIVPSLPGYCQAIGRPDWADLVRPWGCVLHETRPPTILLKSGFTREEWSHALRGPAMHWLDDDAKMARLETPGFFLAHLLLHEIRHVVAGDVHRGMSTPEVERDCDEWAFAQLTAGPA